MISSKSVSICNRFTRHSCTGRYTAARIISYANSVRLSVCLSVTTRYRTKPRWDRDSGSSPYDSLESLVSNEVILVPLGEEIPLKRGHQIGARTPLTHLEIVIFPLGSYSVKTVADRHRLAAYHNKHCRRAFQWYQHRWPWIERPWTPNIGGFSECLVILGCNTHFKN